jgi:hypothetical protein
MICLIALVIFAVLGIFSARYRTLAKQAFRCVFLKLQFKPCDVELDTKIKSTLTSKLLKRSPSAARFVYKRFEALSWVFTIVFFASLAYTVYGVYNLITIGTCDPNSEVCIFDIGAPACGCENICQCEPGTCESPDYLACEGDCQCQKEACEAGG